MASTICKRGVLGWKTGLEGSSAQLSRGPAESTADFSVSSDSEWSNEEKTSILPYMFVTPHLTVMQQLHS